MRWVFSISSNRLCTCDVGRSRPRTRSNSVTPMLFSVWASIRLTAGCEIFNSRAAPLIDPAMTMAHNISVWR
ncbi:hypothetical protein D3C78_1861800 [compost metagenome]